MPLRSENVINNSSTPNEYSLFVEFLTVGTEMDLRQNVPAAIMIYIQNHLGVGIASVGHTISESQKQRKRQRKETHQ